MRAADIIDTVSKYMELNVEDVLHKKSRKADLVMARHLIIYFCRKYVMGRYGWNPMEYTHIARLFKIDGKGLNHATIIHAEKKIQGYVAYNAEIRSVVAGFDKLFQSYVEPDVCTLCGQYKQKHAI